MTEDDCGLVGSVGADLDEPPNYTDRERVLLFRQHVQQLHRELMVVYDWSLIVNNYLISDNRRQPKLMSTKLVRLLDGITEDSFPIRDTCLKADRVWDLWLEEMSASFPAPTKPPSPQTEDDEEELQ